MQNPEWNKGPSFGSPSIIPPPQGTIYRVYYQNLHEIVPTLTNKLGFLYIILQVIVSSV